MWLLKDHLRPIARQLEKIPDQREVLKDQADGIFFIEIS